MGIQASDTERGPNSIDGQGVMRHVNTRVRERRWRGQREVRQNRTEIHEICVNASQEKGRTEHGLVYRNTYEQTRVNIRHKTGCIHYVPSTWVAQTSGLPGRHVRTTTTSGTTTTDEECDGRTINSV